MEPHICRVNWQTPRPDEEWIEVANGGPASVPLTGLAITDFTNLQKNVHIYGFPPTTAGTALLLEPSISAFVFTGRGENRWGTDSNGKRCLYLFMDRSAPIWNNSGDVVYLRELNGQFVDSLTVGAPARHPNGH